MRLRIRNVAAPAALVATFALTACTATSQADGSDAGKAAPGSRMVSTVDGAELKIPDGKPAVVFFFSVACGSCFEGGTAMAEARKKAGAKADFLLVDLDPTEPREAIDYFRDRIGDRELPAVSAGGELAQAWQVTALSTVIVLDPTGEVVYRATDPPAADILAAIDKASAR